MDNLESLTLYEKIKLDIINKIDSGEYKANEKIPSESKLLGIYSVSRITIIKALSELVLEDYIYRIQGKGSFVKPKKINETSIIQNTFFENSSHSTIKKIGIILPHISDYHGINILNGITSELPFPNYYLLISQACNGDIENYSLKTFLANNFDGMIIFPIDSEIYNETIIGMQLKKYPFVLVDRHFQGINTNYVICNNFLGASRATRHLLSLGHKNIAFFASASISEMTSNERLNGYKVALRKAGVVVAADIIFTEIFEDCGFEDTLKDCIRTKKITACLVTNAKTAVYLYDTCQTIGIKVPEDLSIICFDNPSTCTSNSNFFTYIEQQSFEMGKKSAQIVKKLLEQNNEPNYPSQLMLEPQLVIHKSAAAPK